MDNLTPKEIADEEMINQAFHELLNDYLATKHRKRVEIITKAFNFANQAHKGIKRRSGEPYIMHPIAVASIVCNEIGLGSTSICAALLHDVVEDTDYTVEDIENIFGPKIAQIVDGLTKISGGIFGDRASAQAENFKKLLLTMSNDIRVILIKIADRLHNMRTLGSMLPNKQYKIAGETLYIYAPLANRLGLYKIKTELENLSFKYEHPEEYEVIDKKIEAYEKQFSALFEEFIKPIRKSLSENHYEYPITARTTRVYSVWLKMQRRNISFDEIYDLLAVRIVFKPKADQPEKWQCWNIYSLITDIYSPKPERIRDWVSVPKANGYEALHLTVMGPEGQWFEVQIRSERMDEIAEKGFAAHWKYKESGGSNEQNVEGKNSAEAKLTWLRQILEWQRDMSDNREFMSLLKSDLDLFSESVYCFTPGGDVKTLPNGSNTIDFAYSIHSAVGNKMIGARVNGKLVPIETVIKNGDRIEIITSQNSKGPSRDWLNTVKSTQAKNKINQWFKTEFKESNITKGKELIAQYCKMKGIPAAQVVKPEYQESVLRKYGFRDWESVLAAIGHGGLKEGQVVNKMVEEYEKAKKKEVTDAKIMESMKEAKEQKLHVTKSKSGIIVKGIDDVAVRFSKCCNPVPGDEIVGFVTRGRGVTIHRTDCVNMLHLAESERERLIDAEWQGGAQTRSSEKYSTEIKIYGNNRTGLLVDISKTLTERNIDVTSMNVRTSKQGTATITISFDISSVEELNKIIEKLRQIESVLDIERSAS